MKRIELLAPAGDLEKLKIAILYGADAVYIGGKKFSLRARASNFDIPQIEEGVRFARAHQAKVYVTMNIVPHENDMVGLEEYLKALEVAEVSGIIVTSLAIAQVARKITPTMEIHLSTQQSIRNSQAIEWIKTLGFSRVVLAREVSILEIKKIQEKTSVELEVFIHGGMCVSYSGRCMLSNHMTNRDANRGGCAHSCRWNYQLFDGDQMLHDESTYFNMGSKDLMAVREVPALIEAGVSSLKIEGRMKSIYYIATVVRCYRMLLDDYYKNSGQISNIDFYIKEIVKAENRLSATGFLNHEPGMEEQLYNLRSEHPTKEFIGYVLEYDSQTQMALIEQRNHFVVGDQVEFFGPTLPNTTMVVEEMWDENNQSLEVARHPKQLLRIKVPFQIHAHDMMRKIM